MSRKGKINSVDKVKIVERYFNKEVGIEQAGNELGVAPSSIRKWIRIYQSEGATGLLDQKQNRRCSNETKIAAINDYLSGNESLNNICQKYNIR